MSHRTRHLLSISRPYALSSGAPRRIPVRRLFCLGLFAVCVLALPRTSRAQTFNSLYSFSTLPSSTDTNSDGAWPFGGLMQASDGNLYGTAYQGGAHGYGTVFRITTGGKFTTLHSFNFTLFNQTDGAYPYAGLIQASDGNLYGTTLDGGARGYGSVNRITTGGTVTNLYSFNSFNGTDGEYPYAGLIQASDGNLYGTTEAGGTKGYGTVFRITTEGTLTTLYSFTGGKDGGLPFGGLTQASDGNLYGITTGYYSNSAKSDGTVFRITMGGTLTTLYTFSALSGGFTGTNSDGAGPYAGLIQASDANLYGTTYLGGANGSGTVFRITTGGTLTTLYTFSATSGDPIMNSDGASPSAALIQAKDGNLYGTTHFGGPYGVGTVFRITTEGTLTNLHSFTYGSDGGFPYAGLVQASNGNLYGTTVDGGLYGEGTLFVLDLGPVVPILTSIDPSSANAARPAFTLTLNGSSFESSSIVGWAQGTTTTALTTTFVSSTQLKAAVPASLIATAGKAAITVANAGGAVSKSKPFTVLVTTINLSAATLAKTGAGSYTVNLTLKNVGYLTAPNVAITKSTLGTTFTSTTLPMSLGSIVKSKTGAASLSFPSTAGSSGTTVTLKVSGTFTGGTFASSLNVTLP